ncbi:MAG TPA: hypothetical protein VKX17_00695 [Planctomycetota bacterium]|nr:hypothetical protein [Planctomycetota bacterium]
MSDEVKPARRWRFQVHLSTAIVLMCVAGGLIWMNVDEGNDVECLIVRSGGVGIRQCYVSRAYGYPIVARSHLDYITPWDLYGPVVPGKWKLDFGNAALDALYGLVVLFDAWFLCERRIRRRAVRNRT